MSGLHRTWRSELDLHKHSAAYRGAPFRTCAYSIPISYRAARCMDLQPWCVGRFIPQNLLDWILTSIMQIQYFIPINSNCHNLHLSVPTDDEPFLLDIASPPIRTHQSPSSSRRSRGGWLVHTCYVTRMSARKVMDSAC